jgi:hypothetical protein
MLFLFLSARPGLFARSDKFDCLVDVVVACLATDILDRTPERPTTVLAGGAVHVVLLTGTFQAKLHANCHMAFLSVLSRAMQWTNC